MAGPFDEPPYPPLALSDFGPSRPYRVEVHNGGRTVVIGDPNDLAFQMAPRLLRPGPYRIDVVIHGLPDRFVEKMNGRRAIPVAVVAALLESVGVPRGTPLRLLSCHAGEQPASGPCIAQQMATQWGGPMTGPDGLLRIWAGTTGIDLVEWEQDPMGGLRPNPIGPDAGTWATFFP